VGIGFETTPNYMMGLWDGEMGLCMVDNLHPMDVTARGRMLCGIDS
jgi:hypothetical protein